MVKSSQIIFMEGKEIALKKLFNGSDGGIFGYLAVGYDSESDIGFTDPQIDDSASSTGNFKELDEATLEYERIPLSLYETEPVDKDTSTGKVLVKFKATLDTSNITKSQNINQIAVVDNKTIGADTKIYSATTFPTFTKTNNTAITFVIGFRL